MTYKPYDKCPGCKKWCDICYIAMKPKPGKQLTLFNLIDNIQNNKKDDGNHTANMLQDFRRSEHYQSKQLIFT